VPFIIDIETTTTSFKPTYEDDAPKPPSVVQRDIAIAAGKETARILREVADRIELTGMLNPGDKIVLRDAKDNAVGSARVTSSRR
jgi:hypothetical protein